MNKLLLICMCLLVGGAIVGGLMVVGGPKQARLARVDTQRISDLRNLRSHLMCVGHPRKPLPQTLTRHSLHDILANGDPASGAPYVYRRFSDTAFEVCTTLALNPQKARKAAFDQGNIALRADDTLCFIGERAVSIE